MCCLCCVYVVVCFVVCCVVLCCVVLCRVVLCCVVLACVGACVVLWCLGFVLSVVWCSVYGMLGLRFYPDTLCYVMFVCCGVCCDVLLWCGCVGVVCGALCCVVSRSCCPLRAVV